MKILTVFVKITPEFQLSLLGFFFLSVSGEYWSQVFKCMVISHKFFISCFVSGSGLASCH